MPKLVNFNPGTSHRDCTFVAFHKLPIRRDHAEQVVPAASSDLSVGLIGIAGTRIIVSVRLKASDHRSAAENYNRIGADMTDVYNISEPSER